MKLYKKIYANNLFKDIPFYERPREKLISSSEKSLSDLELLMILIGSGNQGRSVDKIAQDTLEVLDNCTDSTKLYDSLKKVRGLGEAKTTLIIASNELTRRYHLPPSQKINSPFDVYEKIRHFADRLQETFITVCLNGANEILSIDIVSIGLVNRTLVHPREVFSNAILHRATSIIVAHNHPSGNLEPSVEDINVTYELQKAANIIKITFLDHIIFTKDNFISLREKGFFKEDEI